MTDHYLTEINANLAAIDKIVGELPQIGKRSELKLKADEILRLTEQVRRIAYLMHVAKLNEDRTPDFGKIWGGVK
jgi:hypothetical protein